MYCENCGNEIKDGSSFCPKCGASVALMEEQQEETQDSRDNGAVSPDSDDFQFSDGIKTPKSNRPKWWFYVVVAVAVAAVIISIVFWANATGRINLNQNGEVLSDAEEGASDESASGESDNTTEDDAFGESDNTTEDDASDESENITDDTASDESENTTDESASDEGENTTDDDASDESENSTDESDSDEIEKITSVSVTASSQLEDADGNSYSPYNLFDNDLTTAYVEGDKEGVGIGETITITLNGEYEIDEIVWYPGYQKNDDILAKNGYPTELRFSFSDGSSVVSTVDSDPSMGEKETVPIDGEVITDRIQVVIDDAVRGSDYSDTCISDIEIYGRKVS